MSGAAAVLLGLSPEVIICLTVLAVIFCDLFYSEARKNITSLAAFGCIMSGLAAVLVWGNLPLSLGVYAETLVVDRLALFFIILINLLTILSIGFTEGSFSEEIKHPGEFYGLLLFTALGCMVAVRAVEFMTFFIAFELLSLPLYVMAAFKRYSSESAEAGFKYFVNGAVSSAFMLYGISWIYGVTGTTFYVDFKDNLVDVPSAAGFLVGVVLVLFALGFKVAVAPFHMWAPDVYQGAPVPVGAYLSTVPKAAIAAVLLRLFWGSLAIPSVSFHFKVDWFMLFAVLSVLSMTLGNLIALVQSDFRRMMAYSGIAHMGYLFLGLAVCTRPGSGPLGSAIAAVIFYSAVYAFANLGAWGVLVTWVKNGGSAKISDFAGLGRKDPFLAFVLLISLFSLAGAPPLAGFVGKLYLFRAVYQGGLLWLVLYAIINSVVSLYYYFGVLKAAYFEKPHSAMPLEVTPAAKAALSFCMVASLVLGLYPQFARLCLDTAVYLLR